MNNKTHPKRDQLSQKPIKQRHHISETRQAKRIENQIELLLFLSQLKSKQRSILFESFREKRNKQKKAKVRRE